MSQDHARCHETLRHIILLMVVLVSLSVRVTAQAVGPEIPVWVDGVPSHRPSVAFDIVHEEFLVVWHNDQGPSATDVYARRVNLDGSLGTWFSIVGGVGQRHFNPVVAFNETRQEYLVAWTYELVAGDHDLFASLVAWNGSSVGTPFPINQDVDLQDHSALAFNPNDDEYLLVYENAWAGGLRDIAAQRVNGDGSLLSWANISTSPGAHRLSPSVAFSPEQDRYLIGYNRQFTGSPTTDIAGKITAPDLAGVSTAPEITIINGSMVNAVNPAVGAATDGFLVQFNLPIDIWAKRLAADGTPQGPPSGFFVSSSVAMAYPNRANAVARADAVGFVSAHHAYGPNYPQIYAQVISPNSDSILSRTFAVAVDSHSNIDPAIACAPWGTCLIVYESDSNIVARLIHLSIFGNGFESGTFSAWSVSVP